MVNNLCLFDVVHTFVNCMIYVFCWNAFNPFFLWEGDTIVLNNKRIMIFDQNKS